MEGNLVVYATSHNIKQFIGNGLLTTLVVLQVEFAQEFIGIIRSGLHGHHSGSMLTRLAIQQRCINHQTKLLRNQDSQNSLQIWLYNEVIIQRFCLRTLAFVSFSLLLAQIFLSLCRSHIRGKVTIVVHSYRLSTEVDRQESLAGQNL